MKLQQLRYFQAACQYNSISAAAKHLHVSQPAISMAIHSLEEEFDLQLLERRYQGFVLTAEGKALYHMTDGILNHAEQVRNRMMDMGRKNVPVRIGVPPMGGATLLTELLTTFLPKHPSFQMTIQEGGTKNLLRSLAESTLDMAFIGHYGSISSEFDSIPVISTEVTWCVNPEHPMADRESVHVEELKDEVFVMFQNGYSVRDAVANRFEERSVPMNIRYEISQLSTIYTLLRQSNTSGFLLRNIEPFFPGLKWIPLNPPIHSTISLIWKAHGNKTKNMKTLIRYFSNENRLTGY